MHCYLQDRLHVNTPKPPIIVVHGGSGVGKTSFAYQAKAPVFIPVEDGLGTLQATRFPLVRSFEEVMDALAALYHEQHDFRTVVVDSADALEMIIWSKICRDSGWKSIEDAGYGRGYVACLGLWRQYLEALTALRDERGMTVIQITHSEIKRFDSPEHGPYDRHVIKLHHRAAALVQEHADVTLFCAHRVSVTKIDVGFSRKINRAVGAGERLMHTSERPAFIAKNRYGLPDTLPLEWEAFARAMPAALQPLLLSDPV